MSHFTAIQKKWLPVTVVIGLTLSFAGLGVGLNSVIISQRNNSQLAELSRQLVSRAELAIDYSVITLSDLLAAGAESCDAGSVALMRDAISNRGAIKNIQVTDNFGKMLCAGLPSQNAVKPALGAESFSSLNQDISLGTIDTAPAGIFKVVWNISKARSFAATLNIDMLMFDIFPSDIRVHSKAALIFGSKAVIAAYNPEQPIEHPERLISFEAPSSRYPIAVKLEVDGTDIAIWNNNSKSAAALIGALLGLMIGLLVSKVIFKPPGPLDELRLALRKGEIQPYFQPIFSLDDLTIVGCEVLMRWVRNGAFVAPPDRFIPLAENSPLIVEMTEVIISESLRKMKPLLDRQPEFKIAFNVTPAHFVSEQFLQRLCNQIAECNVSRRQIVLELTERQAFVDTKKAVRAAQQARDAGFRISLDDTGSGHNGLGYVQELPVNIIKIDKKFIDMVGIDQAATSIVHMLVRLADDLGLSTVAEGVETEMQLHALRKCGVTQGQGYLVSPAVPIERFLSIAESKQVHPTSKNFAKVAACA